MSSPQARVLRALRVATIHHGWATAFEIGRLAGVVTATDALALISDLNSLHEQGLVQREVPPSTGPTVWGLTSAGREAAA